MSRNMTEREWWKEAVIYQIYPQSFKDSNGDGIGDWKGIISKLGYISSLGVDAICLRPFSFYNNLNEKDKEDFKLLLNQAQMLGLKVISERFELPISFPNDHLILRESYHFLNPSEPIKLSELKRIFRKREQSQDDWNCIYWGDHETARVLSRLGNTAKYENESAKMLALILLTLKGTPMIYQGDEIGMSNFVFSSAEDFQDEKVIEIYQNVIKKMGVNEQAFLRICNQIAVDHARTPMQWNSSAFAGFSEVDTPTKVNPNYVRINVASQQEDANSILKFYQEMIRIRKKSPDLIYGKYNDLRPNCNKIFAFKRIGRDFTYLVLNNWTNKTQSFSVKYKASVLNLLLSNYPNDTHYNRNVFELQPYECRIYEYRHN